MSGKYDLLTRYFLSIPAATGELTLSFQQIERILQGQLPASALQYPAWWNYEAHPRQPQKISWQKTGWRVDEPDLSRRQVRFRRFLLAESSAVNKPKPKPADRPPVQESAPVVLATIPLAEMSLRIHQPAWQVVTVIPRGQTLVKGRRNSLYAEICRAAGGVQYRFGCYSWGSPTEVHYCGSFAQDYARGGFKSNLHARMHNYLQNHRVKPTGQKNTNLMVFEQINAALAEHEIRLSVFTFEWMEVDGTRVDFAQYCQDPDLVHLVEQWLIAGCRRQGQCAWNRT